MDPSYLKYYFKNEKISIFINVLLIIIFIYILILSFNIKYLQFQYREYINDCNNLKSYKRNTQINEINPFVSIGIPVYNMEKYIEKSLLSIINQSLQNIEIIIVNDNSKDKTEIILKRFQKKYKYIKTINHSKNLGVYYSRIDAVLNSKGEYFLFIDPDDLLLNPFLFEKIYNYNLRLNLDMMEFMVYHKEEGKKKIFLHDFHVFNHYHDFNQQIIYQPDLSNILFYIPNSKKYTSLICRTVWNKLIRKTIIIKSIEYTQKFFHSAYLITTDDTIINIMNFNFANNYSNIKIPGYLYNIRKNSMSRIDIENKHDIIVCYNYLLFFEFLYDYIKDFKKNLNFLFYDLKVSYLYLLKFKEFNKTEYVRNSINFLNEINKNDISLDFKKFIQDLINRLKN